MLIAYKKINNKKVTIAKKIGIDKEKFKEELKKQNIEFDGIDRIINYDY